VDGLQLEWDRCGEGKQTPCERTGERRKKMRDDFKEKPPGRRWTPEEKEAEIREVCDMYQGVLII